MSRIGGEDHGFLVDVEPGVFEQGRVAAAKVRAQPDRGAQGLGPPLGGEIEQAREDMLFIRLNDGCVTGKDGDGQEGALGVGLAGHGRAQHLFEGQVRPVVGV